MIIAAEYSFNQGKEKIEREYSSLLIEIKDVILQVDAVACKNKISEEQTKLDELLFSPKALNTQFKNFFALKKWSNHKIECNYSNDYYINGYVPKSMGKAPYRDMDFLKEKVGVEVQFGKYAFMVYNVCAKMTIFSKLAGITVGVEIVPIKDLADEMSTGVSYFEQFVWDLENRGVSNIDLPVLILGIAP
ncbi:Restriction endonuclease BglII [Beggiatoa alba B18LD]|uniref:Restriction endonuclease BglII n=1 Tax=Beggiatoa alba B18LD TaxID=395493 RepID=I3CHT9_9GAMM|nr:BglII/BstYI family type II restriction endonuclease [Beggiatoa alba]EIJ43182.1 Restriction endonuclease BglII [Beggiatoa alba B18LD]